LEPNVTPITKEKFTAFLRIKDNLKIAVEVVMIWCGFSHLLRGEIAWVGIQGKDAFPKGGCLTPLTDNFL